jgi:hypothetical protein
MKLRVVPAAVALVFTFAPAAFSGTIGGGPPDFRLGASSSVGGDNLTLTPALTPNPDGSFSTSGQATEPSFSLVFDFSLHADPSVSGSFTLTNLSGTTQTFSVSASLGGLLPIAGPTHIGGSFGDAIYTDANGDSNVEIVSAVFYRALIDNVGVQDLGSFDDMASGGPGVTGTISQLAFGTPPIPSQFNPGGMNSSIGVSFPGFSLTAGDSVQVPFEFIVVPEPSLAALLGITVAVILFTFAREKASRAARRSGRILPTGG